ncbi:MAG: hypothetical protein V4681_01125 [Patescibacteria group bacterium]
MNTRILWVLLIIVIVLVGAWFAFGRTTSDVADTTDVVTTATTTDTNVPSPAKTVVVTYTDQGFSPATASINVGDTVRFMNQSSSDMWVGADEHPTHTNYDGTSRSEHCAAAVNTSFDQCARSGNGTSWSFTFTKAGSFDYHNHARSDDGGTVVVE